MHETKVNTNPKMGENTPFLTGGDQTALLPYFSSFLYVLNKMGDLARHCRCFHWPNKAGKATKLMTCVETFTVEIHTVKNN
jgi:hypothetical protein